MGKNGLVWCRKIKVCQGLYQEVEASVVLDGEQLTWFPGGERSKPRVVLCTIAV